MINKLINKLIPLVDKATVMGDGDCIRVVFPNAIILYDPYHEAILGLYLGELNVESQLYEASPDCKRVLLNTLHDKSLKFIESQIDLVV